MTKTPEVAAIAPPQPDFSEWRSGPMVFFSKASTYITWWVWIVFAIVIAVRTGIHPEKNSVSACYRDACEAWWRGAEMYDDEWNGFIYLPHAAILYSPFYALPLRLGESLNRIVIIALMAWAVWRLTRLTSRRWWNESFCAVSVITIGVGAGNAVNGQFNLPLAAMLMLAASYLIEKRWWIAAICLALSIILKPIAIAPVLLALALYPAMWWRFPVVCVAFFFVPFAFSITHLEYASYEYKTFWETVLHATLPMERRFAEFSTVLWWIGLDLTHGHRTLIRAVAAVLTLAIGWAALRRLGAFRGGLVLWGLGAAYVVIFNPRTEGLTYVLVAPAIALFGAMEFEAERTPRWRRGVGLALLVLGILMIFVHELMPRSGSYFEVAEGRKDLLVRPVISMAFYGWLVWLTLGDRPDSASLPPPVFTPTVRAFR